MGLTVGFDATSAVRQTAGIGRASRELLRALAAREDDMRYRLFWWAAGETAGGLPPLNGKFSLRAVPLSDRLGNAVWQRARLPLPVQLLTGSIDVFHSPDFTLPPVFRRPTVLTVHDLAFLRLPDCAYPTLRAYLEEVVPRSVRRASRIIAISENTRQDLIELVDADPARVAVIPLAPAPEFSPQPAETARARVRQLGLEEPFILCVATLEPRKNYPRLLEAYALLRDRGVEAPLVIAGSKGWLYEPIFQRLEELRLQDHVHFLQPRGPDLVALYSLAEVFVYPALYEGFGLPPLEAMACGAAVACSNTSSLPEAVGDAALTFDPLDVEEMASCIERILADSALRAELQARGVKRASAFSWNETARMTVSVYREAARA